MATNQILVGSEDCRVLKVTHLLKSSQSFHLFHDYWAPIANDLQTKRELVKRLQRNYLLSTIGLIDIVTELLEEWVARESENATLQALAEILVDNGLKDCAESLLKGITTDTEHKQRANKYIQLPTELTKFLSSNSKLCILHTFDSEITCEKITDNVSNHSLLNYLEFFKLLSIPGKRDSDIIYIVKNCPMKRLKLLNKLCDNVENKVILVMCEDQAILINALDQLTSKNKSEFINDNMDWDDLAPTHQLEIMENLEKYYKVDCELDQVNGKLLADLIQGKEVKLFKETLPEELSYFVERVLSTRKFISKKIFKNTTSDVFLFTGIGRYELSALAGNMLTDTSSNQLGHEGLTVSFLIMDQPGHFKKIAEKSLNPVHLISYRDGKLQWIKSKGNLKTLQEYVDQSQDELHEKDFVLNMNSASNQAVIISDSPGMGKSVLLGKIGRRLERKHPERIVFFLVLSEFVKQFRGFKAEDLGLAETIKMVLDSMVSENVIAKAVLTDKFNTNEISIELLLDGFDELESASINLAYEVLHTMISIKALRIWITSRPHLLNELERKLHVLGYNINPFEEIHQIHFLTSYWSRNGQSSQTNLQDFAAQCLKMLKSQIGDDDEDIAGIPLQCLLLGQVFEDEAITNTNAEEAPLKKILITKITDLYNLLIVKKFVKYFTTHANNDTKTTLGFMEMHVRLSLELIYPVYADELNNRFGAVDLKELLKIGILESSSTEKSPRFLHRTFAEYFVAAFVVDKLESNTYWDHTMTDFLVEEVLYCERQNNNFKIYLCQEGIYQGDEDNIIFKFGFAHLTITYFLNSLITDIQYIPFQTIQSITEKCGNSETTGKEISHACARNNFTNILKTFDGIKAFEQHSEVVFSKNCLLLSISNGGVQLVELVLKHFEEHCAWEQDADICAEMLHCAIARGKFSMVEYLIKKKGLRKIVEYLKGWERHVGFLYTCVYETRHRLASEIEERVQIMRLLVGINQDLLEERDTNGDTPLLRQDIHVLLRIELVQLGANVFAQDTNENTILHETYNFYCEEYHTFIASLSDESLRKLVQMKQCEGLTPLISVVKRLDPLPETLTLFKEVDANFNATNQHGLPVLAIAVELHRDVDTLISLKNCGSDINWTKEDGTTLLHIAANASNIEAIKFLVEENPLSLNEHDGFGDTPFHSVLRYAHRKDLLPVNHGANSILTNQADNMPWHLLMQKKNVDFEVVHFLKSNTNIQWTPTPAHLWMIIILQQEIKDKESVLNSFKQECAKDSVELDAHYKDEGGNSLLHHAAKYGCDKALKYLVEIHGIDVNSKNKKQQTVLHAAAMSRKIDIILNILKYLIEQGTDVYARDETGLTFLHLYIFNLSKSLNYNMYLQDVASYCTNNGIGSLFETGGGDDDTSPLHLLVSKLFHKEPGNKTLTLLHSNGINFNVVDKTGNSVLYYAIKARRKTQFIFTLIQFGADYKILNNQHSSVLHITAQLVDLRLLVFFIHRGGLDVNGLDENGNTPLHCAVEEKGENKIVDKVCKFLIAKGSDINIQNKVGETPLSIALKRDFTDSEGQLLLTLGFQFI